MAPPAVNPSVPLTANDDDDRGPKGTHLALPLLLLGRSTVDHNNLKTIFTFIVFHFISLGASSTTNCWRTLQVLVEICRTVLGSRSHELHCLSSVLGRAVSLRAGMQLCFISFRYFSVPLAERREIVLGAAGVVKLFFFFARDVICQGFFEEYLVPTQCSDPRGEM